ncbi:response regulator [Herbaspirillum sp. SJZ099]|uniref:response regulator n=1 Tax=Herbaspirillum sp. SJZ099 TaxID=2572916 RepID=UPI0011AD2D73|nr:response regulator [Herbaspirillum sp. SJZ099]TWC65067.1 CheY-like chemotaxis protein [Herbaspirillum sp. SJZ099]
MTKSHVGNEIARKRELSLLKSLLRRKNIPQKSWARIISEIIGGTRKTASRRLADESVLSLGELFAIADHFKTTVTAMLQSDVPAEKIVPGARKALLRIGKSQCACTVVTRKSAPEAQDLFVAYEDEAEECLVVCPTDDAPKGKAQRGVLHLHVDAFGTSGPVVVIVDDEQTATLPFFRFIQIDGGFNTKYFSHPEPVLALLETRPLPDGYILDWTLADGETSRGLIEAIRRVDKTCPIILLTGTIQARIENENDIAELVRTHNIDVLLKPFPTSIIVEKLKSVLNRQTQMHFAAEAEY